MEFYGVENVYSESGVDLTLLRSNLLKSLDDRLRKNSRVLRNVRAFELECRKSDGRDGDSSMEKPDLEIAGILGALAIHKVQFILIGGLAIRAHGSSYVTDDADFVYERSAINCHALAAAMAPFHPYLRGAPPGLPFKFDAPTIQAGLNFTLVTDLGDVDFLGEIRGIGVFDDVLTMTVEKMAFGHKIQVLSIDGLILAKKLAGRPKDKAHLLELEEIKKLKQAEGN